MATKGVARRRAAVWGVPGRPRKEAGTGPRRRCDIKTIDKALEAARAAQSKKGSNLSIIDVEGRCSYADAIVIASATNERQTLAIAQAIEDVLKKEHDQRPLLREGQGGWVLLDYGDLVVHVFVHELRDYYDLDKLWADAPRVRAPQLDEAVMAEAHDFVLAQARRRVLH